MNKEGIMFLDQLVRSLEETEMKLEEAYEKKDFEGLTRYKNFLLQIQKKISEGLK